MTIEDAARHYAAGDLAETGRVCVELIARDPRQFDALHLLGVVCALRDQRADSVCYLLRAKALRPNDPRMLYNLGNAFASVTRFADAVEAFRQAEAAGVRDAGLHNNLGLALHGLRQFDAAIGAFQTALVQDPGHGPARFNLGRVHAAAGRLIEAEIAFRVVRDRLPPDIPPDRIEDITNELARALMALGRPEDALVELRALFAKRPEMVSLRWNESLILLLLGQYAEGWAAYQSRWLAPDHDRAHPDHCILDLEAVAGRRVLLVQEQGRGDVIQFLRYVRPLAALGALIRLRVYDDLVALAAEIPEAGLVLGENDETDYDFLTSLLDLPLAFQTGIATIPAVIPYLRAPAPRIARMAEYLRAGPERRIGIAWSGSAASHARSGIPALILEPLLRGRDRVFHCLQRDIRPDDRAWLDSVGLVTIHCDLLRDFADTAALIAAMDLVITIDTAIAHLAGALGKPVWIMLSHNPDWRWLLDRTDSPWYPTARLFRQPSPGDWAGVVQAVAAACDS